MSRTIAVPMAQLVLYLGEIGVHRGRDAGLAKVFGLYSLKDMFFTTLARKVKDAYEGKRVPAHRGWPDQREALRWLVDKGRDGIYNLDTSKPMRVRPSHFGRYYITDGHHRMLALYVLGEREIHCRVGDR